MDSQSKPKKSQKSSKEEIDLLKSDVASFVSSIGLSSSVPTSSSGFDDSDFRKTGRLKLHTGAAKKTHTTTPTATAAVVKPHKASEPLKQQDRFDNSNNKRSYEQRWPKPSSESETSGTGKYKNISKFPLVKASALGVWHVDAAELEEKVIGNGDKKKVEFNNVEDWKRLVEKKTELGEKLLAQYTLDYESSRGKTGDVKMLVATQRSGTATDKVSAFSLLVGENPIANVKSLDALLGMVASKVGKRHAFTGFEALKDLFIMSLLPDRKLKTLFQRPLHNLPETKDGYSLLLFWYWEESLKLRYDRFVTSVEEASRDVLAALKDKALKTVYFLLKSKPEQERRLLSALVNKLGDPENKAASNADFHLSRLLSDHPNMKAVVIDEVDTFLFRPHLGLKAKYYAVNFLSQTRLSHKGDGPKVARRLIDVYFALFKVLMSDADGDKKRNEGNGGFISSKDNDAKASLEPHIGMDSRLLSALLTGVNRSFPYVSSSEVDDVIEVQTPMLFRLVHSENFNVGVQALMLLFKISSKNQIVSDRFYRALYSKLLLPAAMNSSKEEMLIGLLLRAMKNDIHLKRVAAFSKRLLQIALQQPPQYACGCLFLLSEVLKARPPLWRMVLQNELVDEDIEHFDDVVDENDNQASANLTKSSVDIPNNTNEIAAHGNGIGSDTDSSDDEDSPESSCPEDDASDTADDLLAGVSSVDVQQHTDGSAKNGFQSQAQPPDMKSSFPGEYNPRHREPSYCNADRVSWWELTVLASHAHPSVATMAKTLLSGANIVYNGNPLKDLSLSAFLDKFMEKKPKQSTWHGGSQIEPAKKELDLRHQLIGAEILSLAETDVPPEDLVFHRFYANKVNSSKKPKKKKKGTEDEDADEFLGVDEDESDNDEIENMLDTENHELEADSDYDDLDRIANEEDTDLVGNISDEDDMDADILADDDADERNNEGDGDVSDDGLEFHHDEKKFNPRIGKRKSDKSVTPFASLEDYEHLLNDEEEIPVDDNAIERKRPKSKKKRKTSK